MAGAFVERFKSGTTTHPMLDRRSLPTYMVVASSFFLSISSVLAMGFTVAPAAIAVFWSWPFLAFGGMLSRRIGQPKLGAALEGTALLYGQGLATLLLLFPLAALSAPYADATLARWDAALGLDWPRFLDWCVPYAKPLIIAYKSFAWQPLVVVAALVATDKLDRLWLLTCATAIAGLVTSALFPFFPGEGVFLYYGINLNDYPSFKVIPTWTFTPVLENLRNGGRIIDRSMFTGLVSFPSYHAVIAVQLAWATWQVRWLRWPMVLLNALVLFATPVIGAHYFVDVIGGAVVAAISIIAANWLCKRNAPGFAATSVSDESPIARP